MSYAPRHAARPSRVREDANASDIALGGDDVDGVDSMESASGFEKPASPAGVTADVGRSSLIVSLGTLASRASGQLRSIALIGALGTTALVANAFDLANTLPNMLHVMLASGVLNAVLMPQIMQAIRRDNSKERLDKLITLSFAALALITVVLVVSAPLLVRMFTLLGDVSPGTIAMAIAFAYWCIPQVFFYGVFAVISQVLNARGQFAAAGWAPIANNIISVAGFGAFIMMFGSQQYLDQDMTSWTWQMTAVLGMTATAGIAAQTVILMIALKRGGFAWRPRFGLHGIGLRSAGKVVGWTIGAVALEQISVIFLRNVTVAASEIGAEYGHVYAGPASFTNAVMVYVLPNSIIGASIAVALFPRMTMAGAKNDLVALRDHMSSGIRSIGVFTVFFTGVMLVLARPLMITLVPTLSATDARVGAPILRMLALGMVALGANTMVRRTFFALEDGRGVFAIQVVTTTVMITTLWLATLGLSPAYWAVAAAFAQALSGWVAVLGRVRGLKVRLGGVDGFRIVRLHVRAIVATLFAAAAGAGVSHQLGGFAPTMSWFRAALVTTMAGLTMAAVYFSGLKLMHVTELDDALQPIMKRLGRGRGG